MRRQFDFGNTFGRIFSVLGGGFPTWAAVSLTFFVPILLLSFLGYFVFGIRFDLFVQTGNEVQDPLALLSALIPFSILVQVHAQLTTAGLMHGVFRLLREESPSAGECINKALSRFWAVLGLSIIQSVAISVGVVLCCIPGFMVAVLWYVAMPALIVENIGVGEAISRSQFLTLGSRWPIFGIAALLMVIILIIGGVTSLFAFLGPTAYMIIYLASLVISPLFAAVGPGVVYHDLREVKEGLDEQDLEEVFA